MGKRRDGTFEEIDPKTGFNKHFYEGTCWIYSYFIPQDVPATIQYMGGPNVFTERLVHALDNEYAGSSRLQDKIIITFMGLPIGRSQYNYRGK